jgi:ATP-dependent Lon protease
MNLQRDKTGDVTVPILPLRDTVLFPGAVLPLTIGRPASLKLMEDHSESSTLIGMISQRDKEVEEPGEKDLYRVGTMARVLQTLRKGSKGLYVVVQGVSRFRLRRVVESEPYLKAVVDPIQEDTTQDAETEALMVNLKTQAAELINAIPELPDSATEMIEQIESPPQLVYVIMAYLPVLVEQKVEVLGLTNIKGAIKRTLDLLQHQLEVVRITQKIKSDVKGKMDRSQKEYVLRQQLKAIQEELGEVEPEGEVLEELREKLEKAGVPEEVRKVADKELRRLRAIQPASPEYTVVRNYLDWIADMPWKKQTDDNLDIGNARAVLDRDHYDLDKVKKRILEYLAVKKLKDDMKGPILCLVGPPGVGKTSLGQSIAEALGRKFTRMSLGGVRDEAEIRGHRRTYIGALPGRIIQSIKRAESKNPVFMLDEVDKLGRDWRGDPTSALLEVLDPEQNHSFMDHYLDVPFDLSSVLFIATANMTDTIPPPLLDRMEVLELPGYTQDEKLAIARRHLLPKQIKENGLKPSQLTMSDPVINHIMDRYTREAGVRNLERRLADAARAVAVGVVEGRWDDREVTVEDLRDFLGPERYESEMAQRTEKPGIAVGLAKTAAGGEILFIEATRMPGSGKLKLTGQLGDVMKESAELALSYIRAMMKELGIDGDRFEKTDIHVHVPAGAVPKDGPSAGVTLLTALVSLLTDTQVRDDVAMTGEITLRGQVLPVGGIKDKVLAALRGGLKKVILPERNRKDLPEIPEEVRSQLEFVFCAQMSEVLATALRNPPTGMSGAA